MVTTYNLSEAVHILHLPLSVCVYMDHLFMCIIKNIYYFYILFLQGFGSASTVSLPESLLFVSTLDGNLHAVSKKSGSIKWTLKEGKTGAALNFSLFSYLNSGYICKRKCLLFCHGKYNENVIF